MKKQTHAELFNELMESRCHGNLSLNCDDSPITALMTHAGYVPVCESHLKEVAKV